jgi:hypothetical protein
MPQAAAVLQPQLLDMTLGGIERGRENGEVVSRGWENRVGGEGGGSMTCSGGSDAAHYHRAQLPECLSGHVRRMRVSIPIISSV